MFYEATYRVDSRDADPQGHCRPSSILGYLQEAATQAALALGIGRETMLERYNAFWMMARIWYRLKKPVRWDDSITVRTWHRGDKGACMYRDFDLYRGDEQIGEAVSVWVLADLQTRGLFRLSKAVEFEGTSGGELCKSKMLSKLHIPGPLTPGEDRTLHYSDADINAHVNNVRYADFACDALGMEALGKGKYVSELQIGYLAECRPGETIHMSTGRLDDYFLVQGKGDEGKARFDVSLLLSTI